MKEKIEKIDFVTISQQETDELVNELKNYEGEELTELVLAIIDTIDYSVLNSDKLPEHVNKMFYEPFIKTVVEKILEETTNNNI